MFEVPGNAEIKPNAYFPFLARPKRPGNGTQLSNFAMQVQAQSQIPVAIGSNNL